MNETKNCAEIFDRRRVRLHRDRAAMKFTKHNFLFREFGARLADRLLDIERQFPLALDLGCHNGGLESQLPCERGIETLVQCDLSASMARQANSSALVADEELLPFTEQQFDLILSNLSLHWTNDLPGVLFQLRRLLKSDGLFLATLFGSGTLIEFRECLTEAVRTKIGGTAQNLPPLPRLGDAAALLQRAGFSLPVADSDIITVTYTDAFHLMSDLRGMGEGNATARRSIPPNTRDILFQAAELYRDRYERFDGTLPATFEVIYLHGWSPHASQQKALAPGSATMRLADALAKK